MWKMILLIMMLVVTCLVCMSGCQIWKNMLGNSENSQNNSSESYRTIVQRRIALLPSLGIVAASASVLVIFLGATKIGVAALGASLFGTWMSLTLASYSNVFSIAGMVAAIVLAGVMVYRIRKANVQLVSGVQALKSILPKEKVNEMVAKFQDSDVVKEVERVKQKLKKSGRIV